MQGPMSLRPFRGPGAGPDDNTGELEFALLKLAFVGGHYLVHRFLNKCMRELVESLFGAFKVELPVVGLYRLFLK
jgi:hypothetical protein